MFFPPVGEVSDPWHTTVFQPTGQTIAVELPQAQVVGIISVKRSAESFHSY